MFKAGIIACPVLIGVLIISNMTISAERMVIGELITNTSWITCYYSDQVLDQLAVTYQDDFALVRYHGWWPGNDDPFYQYNMIENTERINYYGFDYVPHLRIDGIVDGAYHIDAWEGLIADRINEFSPLAIDVDGYYDEDNRIGEATVIINCELTPSVSSLKLRIAITESHIVWQAPNGTNIHDQTFRDMIPNAAGDSFVISQGEARQFTYQFEIEGSLEPENCEIAAFVQSDESHEILQSAKVRVAELQQPAGADDDIQSPLDFSLNQNYPNPFNASTAIDFRTEGGRVMISIHDITGALIKTLIDRILKKGEYNVAWSGEDYDGKSVSSGIYFYLLSDSSGEHVRKMILLK